MEVLITYFLKYLLAPFLVAAILLMMNGIKAIKKQLKFKNVIVYILITGLLLGIPGCLSILKDEFVWGGVFIVNVLYLFLGCLFAYTMNNNVARKIGVDGNMVSQVLIMLICGLLGGWIHFLLFEKLGGMPYAPWSMLSVIWYTLPFLTLLSLRAFHKIPPPLYELWSFGQSGFNRNQWDNTDNFQAIPVKVRIKRRQEDEEYASLTVRLQDNISLGDWFNWLVEDQNRRSPMHQIDVNDSSVNAGWIFYTTRWINYPLFIRVLNPEQDRRENAIRKNQIIYIKRIIVEESKAHETD